MYMHNSWYCVVTVWKTLIQSSRLYSTTCINNLNIYFFLKTNSDDLIYAIVPTSGTTGEPKAAILKHKGIMYFAASYYATTATVLKNSLNKKFR